MQSFKEEEYMTSTQHFHQHSPVVCDSGNPWNKNLFFLFISYQCISYPSAFPASHTNVWHPQPPVARSPTAPFISLCLASFWLYLVLPAAHLKGEWPVNPSHPPHPSQGFIFDLVHGWSGLICLLFTRKLFLLLSILIASYEPLSTCISFDWREGTAQS